MDTWSKVLVLFIGASKLADFFGGMSSLFHVLFIGLQVEFFELMGEEDCKLIQWFE